MGKSAASTSALGRSGSGAGGTLRSKPRNCSPGDKCLTIEIVKWSFKDATVFEKPVVATSVRDSKGKLLEAVQVRNLTVLQHPGTWAPPVFAHATATTRP
jgi:hypothetical protein